MTQNHPKAPTERTLQQTMKPYLLCSSYRGRVSEQFGKNLKKLCNINVVFTTKKLRSCLMSLKAAVPVALKSKVIYEILCPSCGRAYIGQTARHLQVRVKEHGRKGSPLHEHFKQCNSVVTINNATIIDSTQTGISLLPLEAVYIKRRKPDLNTKDEYRNHHHLQYAF